MDKIETFSELETHRKALAAEYSPQHHWITVCGGTGCRVYGSEEVWKAFQQELDRQRALARLDYDVKVTGCHGFCEKGPLVVIRPDDILYAHVQVKDVAEIVRETVLGGRVIERLLYVDPQSKQKIEREHDVPFYRHQQRQILRQNGSLDPCNLDEFIAGGGYAALEKALAMTPEEIITEVKASGLRGRGGAGFPAGLKVGTVPEECAASGRRIHHLQCRRG